MKHTKEDNWYTNLIKSTLVVVLLLVMAVACKDETPDPQSKFTIGTRDYKLDHGYAYLDETIEVNGVKVYKWAVYLLSDGIQVAGIGDFSGEGNALVFTFYASNDASFIPAGNYKSSDSSIDNDGCAIYTGYNIEASTGNVYEDIDDVSVSITRIGSTASEYIFTMKYTLTLADGTLVNGSYHGTVENI